MCYLMNIECFHSQFGLWLFSSGSYNERIKLSLIPCMRLLSYAELSSHLLFNTFLTCVVHGDGLNIIRTLTLSMAAFYHTYILVRKTIYFLFENSVTWTLHCKIRQICHNSEEFQCISPQFNLKVQITMKEPTQLVLVLPILILSPFPKGSSPAWLSSQIPEKKNSQEPLKLNIQLAGNSVSELKASFPPLSKSQQNTVPCDMLCLNVRKNLPGHFSWVSYCRCAMTGKEKGND